MAPGSGADETVIVRGRNTQARKRTKRSTVAAALAATMTPSSTAWLAAGARTPSRARAPVVRPSPSPKMIRPWNWWRAAPSRPRTPKVSRRFAAVFAMLVSSSATTFAAIAPIIAAEQQEQQQVRDGARHADRGEPDQLARHGRRHPGHARCERRPAELRAQLGDGQCPRAERAADPPDAAQVGHRRRDDVHAGVGVVDPVDGHLVDPQARALGEHQHLGVEEPAGVLDERQQPAGDVGADGLEAALGVGEAGLQGAAQEQVVAAGDELPLRAADDP